MLLNLIIVLLVLVLLLTYLLLPGESDMAHRAPFWGMNVAHRGLYAQNQSVPENSLPAFAAAVEAGYGIEFDVRLTKDGEVVVFHDDTLERVCGLARRVDELDWEQLKALELFGSGQRIPLLSEVLECVGGRVPLVIELKKGPQNAQLCDSAWRILRRYDGDICVESFDPRIVRWFMKHAPGLLRGQLAAPPKSLDAGAAGAAVGLLLTNFLCRPNFIAYQKGPKPLTVRLAERFAMRVTWTVHPDDDLRAIEAEADAIIFEHYQPPVRFKDLPEEVLMAKHDFFAKPNEDMFIQQGPTFGETLSEEEQAQQPTDAGQPGGAGAEGEPAEASGAQAEKQAGKQAEKPTDEPERP